MKYSRLSLLIFCICFVCFFPCTQGRKHNHTKHKHNHTHKSSSISQPPSPPPQPADPPNGGSPYNYTGLYDVRNFGAVGDGIADDTEAFKMAWDAACQSGSAVILVPYGFSFMIQSAIFTGPCQGGLVFQVVSSFWASLNLFYTFEVWLFLVTGFILDHREGWWNSCSPGWTWFLAEEQQ